MYTTLKARYLTSSVPIFPALLPLSLYVIHLSLQLLLQEVLRPVICLVIYMHIRPLHIGQTLQLDLKFFSYIMRSAECRFGVHDDVDFDDEAGAAVVGAYGIDLEDGGRVCHRCENN